MRNRCKRVALWPLVAIAALVALVLLLARLPNEPRYEGRPLSYWVDLMLRPPGYLGPYIPDVRPISENGTNAFPYLVKWATYTTPHWQATLGNLALKAGLPQAQYRRLPYVKKEHRADAALEALAQLRGQAWPALAGLAQVAANSHRTNTITRARRCLYHLIENSQDRALWTEPSPMLLAALAHTNPVVRTEATNVLRKWYPIFQDDVRARLP